MKKCLLGLMLFPMIARGADTSPNNWKLDKSVFTYTELLNETVNVRLNPRLLGVVDTRMSIMWHTLFQNHVHIYGGINPVTTIYYKSYGYSFSGGGGGVGYSLYSLHQNPDKSTSGSIFSFDFGGGGGYLVTSGEMTKESKEVLKELGDTHDITAELELNIQQSYFFSSQGINIKTGLFYNILENSFGIKIGLGYILA